MNSKVISGVAVRRPLSIPSCIDCYGVVLCHSATVITSVTGYYMIEYMNDNFVHVTRCNNYIPGRNFKFQKRIWIHDDPDQKFSSINFTVGDFAISMAKIMKEKKFNTYTHNCLNARYLTMKKYGMMSRDPLNNKRCIFFQGWFDYYGKKYRIPNIEKKNLKDFSFQQMK